MEEKYYTLEDAYKFLEECKRNKIKIYGIERFIEINGGIMPDMSGIADFSHSHIEQSFISSEKFLNHFNSGLFTFVTEEDT